MLIGRAESGNATAEFRLAGRTRWTTGAPEGESRRCVGNAELPSRDMQPLSASLARCSAMAMASRRTKRKPHAGSAGRRTGRAEASTTLACSMTTTWRSEGRSGAALVPQAAGEGEAVAQYTSHYDLPWWRSSKGSKRKLVHWCAESCEQGAHRLGLTLVRHMTTVRVFQRMRLKPISG